MAHGGNQLSDDCGQAICSGGKGRVFFVGQDETEGFNRAFQLVGSHCMECSTEGIPEASLYLGLQSYPVIRRKTLASPFHHRGKDVPRRMWFAGAFSLKISLIGHIFIPRSY